MYSKVQKVFNLDDYDYSIKWLWNVKGIRRFNLVLVERGKKQFFKDLYAHMEKHPGIYHFLYPENTLAFFDQPIPKGVTIVSSFHQPQQYWTDLRTEKGGLKMLENFSKTEVSIGLSKHQLTVIEKEVPGSRRYFVPHGVDVHYFKPGEHRRESRSVLIVGSWLRDFEAARKVADEMNIVDPSVHFTVVTSASNAVYFENAQNVTFRSNISNEDLVDLYQRSTLLFLPLKGAVANNAMLEAAACGLPIISTFHHEILDYFNQEDLLFFDKASHEDPEFIAEKILEALNNSEELAKRSINLRKNAELLSWEKIAERLDEIYSLEMKMKH
jgi:glycosyltransferase involved in cell wall biosynthesis